MGTFKISDKTNITAGNCAAGNELLLDVGTDYKALTLTALAEYIGTSLGVISLKAFGAVGDGVTDDTSAVQSAVEYAGTNGVGLYVPAGQYKCTARILHTATYNWSMWGEGQDVSIFVFTSATSSGFNLTIPWPQSSPMRGASTFHDFSILKGGSSASVDGTAFTISTGTGSGGAGRAVVYNLYNIGIGTLPSSSGIYWLNGIHINGYGSVGGAAASIYNCNIVGRTQNALLAGSGIILDTSTGSRIENCQITWMIRGVYVIGYSEGPNILNCNFVSCYYGVMAMTDSEQPGLEIIGCHFNCYRGNIYLSDRNAFLISNCYMYQQTNAANVQTVSSINTSTDVITMTVSHGWAANQEVYIQSTATLPAELSEGTVYYVVSPSGADLKLSLSSGGAAIDLSTEGTGTITIYEVLSDYYDIAIVGASDFGIISSNYFGASAEDSSPENTTVAIYIGNLADAVSNVTIYGNIIRNRDIGIYIRSTSTYINYYGNDTLGLTTAISDNRSFPFTNSFPASNRAMSNAFITLGGVANQAIPDTTLTVLTTVFGSGDIYNDGGGTTTTTDGEIKVMDGTRTVTLTACILWASNSIGYRRARMLKNGAWVNGLPDVICDAVSSTNTMMNLASAPIPCTKDDIFTIQVIQSSGGDLNVLGSETWFSMGVVA